MHCHATDDDYHWDGVSRQRIKSRDFSSKKAKEEAKSDRQAKSRAAVWFFQRDVWMIVRDIGVST